MAGLTARLLHEGDQPLFLLNRKTYKSSSDKRASKFHMRAKDTCLQRTGPRT